MWNWKMVSLLANVKEYREVADILKNDIRAILQQYLDCDKDWYVRMGPWLISDILK